MWVGQGGYGCRICFITLCAVEIGVIRCLKKRMVSATPVPTTFVGNKAVIKSLTNSTYVVVEGTHTFGDIEQHWAKGYIETLAAKQLVKGMTETAYRPNEQMTRAQFAVLLVRALALPHGNI